MKAYFRGKVYEFNERMKVKELLKKMGLLPEYVIVAKRNPSNNDLTILIEEDFVEKDDEVEILSAISGGGWSKIMGDGR
jgi:sulfur carrier protein ThiS